jgi:hypothetical protein
MPLNQIASSFVQPGATVQPYATGVHYPPTIGRFNIANAGPTADRLVAAPFFCRESRAFAGMALYQHSAATTGNIRYGIYTNTGARPVALFQDVGAVAFPASTGWRTVSTTINLVAGTLYWLACVSDTTAIGVSTIEASDPPQGQSLLGQEFGFSSALALNNAAFINNVGFGGTHAYAALPNPFPTISNYAGAFGMPCVCLVG